MEVKWGKKSPLYPGQRAAAMLLHPHTNRTKEWHPFQGETDQSGRSDSDLLVPFCSAVCGAPETRSLESKEEQHDQTTRVMSFKGNNRKDKNKPTLLCRNQNVSYLLMGFMRLRYFSSYFNGVYKMLNHWKIGADVIIFKI